MDSTRLLNNDRRCNTTTSFISNELTNRNHATTRRELSFNLASNASPRNYSFIEFGNNNFDPYNNNYLNLNSSSSSNSKKRPISGNSRMRQILLQNQKALNKIAHNLQSSTSNSNMAKQPSTVNTQRSNNTTGASPFNSSSLNNMQSSRLKTPNPTSSHIIKCPFKQDLRSKLIAVQRNGYGDEQNQLMDRFESIGNQNVSHCRCRSALLSRRAMMQSKNSTSNVDETLVDSSRTSNDNFRVSRAFPYILLVIIKYKWISFKKKEATDQSIDRADR